MDNLRLFLWVGLGLLLWLNIQAWQRDYPATPMAPVAEQQAEIPTAENPAELPSLPSLPNVADETTPEAANSAPVPRGQSIRVRSDVLDLKIGLTGGDIRSAALPAYPLKKDQPDVPVTLLNEEPETLYVFRTGLRAANGQPEANHRVAFTAAQDEYQLADGQDQMEVVLNWRDASGISVDKVYIIRRGRYNIDVEYRIRNDSAADYSAVAYQQIYRRHQPPDRSMFDVDSYSYVGPVAYDGKKYEKLDPDDLLDEPLERTATNGWLASIQHHFLAAVVPPAQQTVSYQAVFDGRDYTATAIGGELLSVSPGATGILKNQLFIGPKMQSQLEETAKGLALTVDYGLLTLLAQPLFWVLEKVHSFIGNWGWTIIVVTFMIKLVFYKLTETSGRSMAKMRKMQPRMKALQDRYKDDREAMSKALMDLYKKEKVNPAAGCLPMLVQIPFFIAFYWTLLESVEMRQAPFMLWITDLSSRDPFFILPLLMGGAMWFQQKLNPAPPDPVQAKVMQFLPVIFTGMFAFFPAGLVLYWLTNSVLSIAQQWRINKVLGADAPLVK
jgi:YidC/Oxa1 family membrane protein insertase